MIEGVETGYEEKFDFPLRDCPPEQIYVLASVPRSGSTFVSHLLWRTGCLGAPLEYLNFDRAGPYYFAARSKSAQLALWQSILRRRTSPNGVFGAKCFAIQLEGLKQGNPELLDSVMATLVPPEKPRRVVYVARRDRLAQGAGSKRQRASRLFANGDRTCPRVDRSGVRGLGADLRRTCNRAADIVV